MTSTSANTFFEPARLLSIAAEHDIVVCGGGPAGIAAAIAAARSGADTCLIEAQGCLGGVWTSGLLSLILDSHNKPGLMRELRERLRERGAIQEHRDIYDSEAMKVVLEDLCTEAGVHVRLYTRLVATDVEDRCIKHVILEAKEGRFGIGASCFIDTTGDGDLGALAGCGFDLGRPDDGAVQPMTLMALVANLPPSIAAVPPPGNRNSSIDSKMLMKMLTGVGVDPSYSCPSIFMLPNGIGAMMVNHIYERSALSSRDLTTASISARREIQHIVNGMKRMAPEWSGVTLVATAAHIGVREGRRIHGDYKLTADDLGAGRRFADGIARVTFPVDVHSLRLSEGGGHGGHSKHRMPSQPYDIPLRSLIARDLDNLFLAGRCISGDFHAHASYRVTGNAVATGEAAGRAAARMVATGMDVHAIPSEPLEEWLHDLLP